MNEYAGFERDIAIVAEAISKPTDTAAFEKVREAWGRLTDAQRAESEEPEKP